jgi:hypothetical protein
VEYLGGSKGSWREQEHGLETRPQARPDEGRHGDDQKDGEGVRADIESRPLLVKDVAAQLAEIARQKPDATLAVRDGKYGCLVDSVGYEAEDNAAVIEIVINY